MYACVHVCVIGSAMTQAISRRLLNTEARVHARVKPCGNCSGQSVTETGSSPSSLILPCKYHSAVAVQTHTPGGLIIGRW
jgi:hypothetical protein